MPMMTLEQLEEEIARMQREISRLHYLIKPLEDERHNLEQRLVFFRREASRVRAIYRETTSADRWQQWLDDPAVHGHRWSPRWWSSAGWADLAEDVLGVDWQQHNLCWLIAAFAELDGIDQLVLERRYAIGVAKLTLDTLAECIPYKDFTKMGVSRERIRQREARTLRTLRSKWRNVAKMEVCDEADLA